MIDLNQALFTTDANSFKNTGVYDTSITASGAVGAGATRTFTSTINLNENQVFCYAIANYQDFVRLGGNRWQSLPTFDLYIATTPIGNINWFLYYTTSGSTVIFTLGLRNPFPSTETIPSTTINIRYVTYTLAN